MVETSIVIDDFTISDDEIVELTINESASLMLNQMATDSCEAVVKSDSDYLDTLAYGTQVKIYRGSAILDVFYLTEVIKIKANQYKLEMTSFLGILDGEMFYGGYYTGETLREVIETIIQTNGLNLTTTDHADIIATVEFDAAFADLPIYGWLQVGTKKEALHQVLFSRGISMKKTTTGIIIFTSLYDDDPIVIDAAETYIDGDVTFLEKVSIVEVTEHAFTNDPSASLDLLFESEQQTEFGIEYIAIFNSSSPVLRPIQVTGLTVLYQNCNAAVVTGIGTIKGYQSAHSQTVKRSRIRQEQGETASINDCTLITRQNSAYMLNRFENYYLTAETEINSDFIKSNQRIGSLVSIVNSFGERVSGYITEINQTLSGIIKAACKIVTGYKPLDYDGYNRFVVLTGTGSWIVPESVFAEENPRIQVVLVGGGTGGSSGLAGSTGAKVPYGDTSKTGAPGGRAGNGGDGGKILVATINNPASVIYFSCGQGGAGGAATSSTSVSNPGSLGSATTLTSGETTYTSENGDRNDNGITNFMSGMRYGLSYNGKNTGAEVTAYGDGYAGKKMYWENGQIKDNYVAFEYTLWESFDMSKTPPEIVMGWSFFPNAGADAGGGSGGAGGGNAFGGQGNAGGNASSSASGTGGKGKDATVVFPKPSQIIGTLISGSTELFLPSDDGAYGDGGFGGFGGGGGGSGGATNSGKTQGSGGAGGKGGAGGYGADGCVIIYY